MSITNTKRKYTAVNRFSFISLNTRTMITRMAENKKLIFNLENVSDKYEFVTSKSYYRPNALCDQICLLLMEKGAVNEEDFDSDSLTPYLLYADFKSRFPTFYKKNKDNPAPEIFPETDTTPEGEAFETLIREGFSMTYDESQGSFHYVAFDKSASMSRECRITFIREDIKEELDKRLLLDMDFSKITVQPSKFYAYKGLYLSSGTRIPHEELFDKDDNLAERIIVIKDDSVSFCGDVITDVNAQGQPDNFKIETKEKFKANLNPFDGEGIISPDMAVKLRKSLGNNATTFQIRMPFIKGLLHEVDFKRFFAEELTINDSNDIIIDFFGIERHLLKADIILTESMVKNCKWMKKLKAKGGLSEDPMAYYFEKYNKYSHSLYIGLTNCNLNNNGLLPMNYQFLNTLALTPAELEKLVQKHKNRITNAKNNDKKLLKLLGISNQDTAESNSDSSMEDNEPDNTESKSPDDTMKKALNKNPAFFSEPKVKELLSSVLLSRTKDIGIGRLLVSGEQRFLSGDLLALLVYIGKQLRINKETQKDNIVNRINSLVKKEALFSSKMYVPQISLTKCGYLHSYDKNGKTISERYYAILRNPHLSQNEDCLLAIAHSKDTLYEKYFSHLTGVVMVAYRSPAPMTLGGADFDGDLVKIIGEPSIVKAIRFGTYTDGINNQLTRTLSIPYIQGREVTNDKNITEDDVYLDTIKDTFRNSIGTLSNAAILFGMHPNSAEAPEALIAPKDLCAACTILTGLEIDAAKTGNHPTKHIAYVCKKSNEKEYQSDFLITQNEIKSFQYLQVSMPCTKSRKDYGPKYTINKVIQVPELFAKYQSETTLGEEIEIAKIPLLERLPAFLARYECEEPKLSSFKYTSEASDKKLFTFEVSTEDTDWRDALDEATRKKVWALIIAYKNINKKIRYRYKMLDNRIFHDYFYHIIKKQYDSYQAIVPGTNATCDKAINDLFSFLYQKYSASDSSAIDTLTGIIDTDDWIYTPKGERLNKLQKYFNISSSEELCDNDIAALCLLTNFKCDGYMLLIYVLKALSLHMQEEKREYDSIPDKTNDTDKQLPKAIDTEYYNNVSQKLEQILKEGIEGRWDKAYVTYQIKILCGEELKLCIPKSQPVDWQKKALEYIYAAPKSWDNHSFMWEFISWNAMKDLINTNNQQETVNNA